MACLAACGQEEREMTAEEQNLLTYGESLVEATNADVERGVADQCEKMLEQYPRLTPEQIGLTSEKYAELTGWKAALEDIGVFQQTSGGRAVINEEEATADIQVNVVGSDHNATVEIVLDLLTGEAQSFTVNVDYSPGELAMKAVMNTVIGMGTVFAVLILISLIISCFTLISKTEAKRQKKTETPAPADDPVVEQIAAKEELSDDTELVAVIAAAIAAYEGAASTDGFVVRSIRKSNKSKWQNA